MYERGRLDGRPSLVLAATKRSRMGVRLTQLSGQWPLQVTARRGEPLAGSGSCLPLHGVSLTQDTRAC